MAHARFSPSNSKRWLNCTQSMLLPVRNERGETSYAQRGTALHEAAEDVLAGRELSESYNGYTPTAEDLEDTVIPYVQYIMALKADSKTYEQKVYITEECYGTADCIAYDTETRTLHVADLKAGQGVFVPVVDNTQIQIYALGALKVFREEGLPVDKVVTHIIQPGMNNYGAVEVSSETLADLYKDIVQTIEDVNNEKGVYYASEESCKFCPHKVSCPKLIEIANKAATDTFIGVDLSEKLQMVPVLKLFINAIEKESLQSAQRGITIPGFKLVRGKGNRKWVDEEKIRAALAESEIDSSIVFTPPKLLSVAQLEKALKKNKIDFEMDEFIGRTDSAEKLVPDSNPQKEINKTEEAQPAFQNI